MAAKEGREEKKRLIKIWVITAAEQIHPAKTKLSSFCFAELEFKGKGGSRERGKWVSKRNGERAAVLWRIAPSLSGPGLLN